MATDVSYVSVVGGDFSLLGIECPLVLSKMDLPLFV